MSLPTKIVPKPATVAVSGPGTVPSPSSQLRATLTSVSLPPGAPGAPQPNAVPPPQYPSLARIPLASLGQVFGVNTFRYLASNVIG